MEICFIGDSLVNVPFSFFIFSSFVLTYFVVFSFLGHSLFVALLTGSSCLINILTIVFRGRVNVN